MGETDGPGFHCFEELNKLGLLISQIKSFEGEALSLFENKFGISSLRMCGKLYAFMRYTILPLQEVKYMKQGNRGKNLGKDHGCNEV